MKREAKITKVLPILLAVLTMLSILYAGSITAHAVSGPRPSNEAGILVGFTRFGDHEVMYFGSDKKTSAKFEKFSYNKNTNTLTISNSGTDEDYYLELYDMGDDFKLNVKGKNSLGYIGIYSNAKDRMNLTITGSGSLRVNSDGVYGAAIHGYANGKSNTKITIDNTVNANLYGGENIFTGKKEKVIVVENAKSSKQADVFRIGGKKTGSTKVAKKKSKKGYTYSYGGYSLKIRKSGESFLKKSSSSSSSSKKSTTAKTFTVKYNLNGGEGSISNQTKKKGKNLTLSSKKPKKSGAIFTGWSVEKNGAVKYKPGGTYKSDSNVTLYAKWRKTVTSTDDSYTKGFKAAVKEYPAFKTMTAAGSFPIPGITSCCSTTKGFAGECDEMVPQGICAAKGYIFITAYCKGKKHNSVLHVLRQSDNKYVGTVSLGHINNKTAISTYDHNGGIAYDNYKHLWIANSDSGYVSAVDVNTVVNRAKDGGKNRAYLVEYDGYFECKGSNGKKIKAASFLTYDDGTLWVGYCADDDNNRATLYGYSISYASGKPGAVKYERAWPIQHNANGAAFVDKGGKKYLLVSNQTGKKHRESNSEIVCYLANDNGTTCSFKKIKTVQLPPMLEEVEISGNSIYSVYESAAKEYRGGVKKRGSVRMNVGSVAIGSKSKVLDLLGIN